MSSFNQFSPYTAKFSRLDQRITDEAAQQKYYNRWMLKYSKLFSKDDDFPVLEWDLRCRKALREIFSSATFLAEAKVNLKMNCYSSYYFCIYYSLFHALYAALFLDTETELDKLFEVNHSNLITRFISAYGNTKDDIMDKHTAEMFKHLKYQREYYSYSTPFNNLFDRNSELDSVHNTILTCFQLAAFHSLMLEKSCRKHSNGITRITAYYKSRFDAIFPQLFAKADEEGNIRFDDSALNMRAEIMRDGVMPEYILIDLEHHFDEFHTYDSFGADNPENALKIADIWKDISDALIFG